VARAGRYLNMTLMANEELRATLDPLDLLPYYAESDVVIVPLRSGRTFASIELISRFHDRRC